MKQCPECGRENEEHTWLCECGYEFGGPEDTAPPGSRPPPLPREPSKQWDGCVKSAVLALAVIFGVATVYGIMIAVYIRIIIPRFLHH